jgi:hypothetical protein
VTRDPGGVLFVDGQAGRAASLPAGSEELLFIAVGPDEIDVPGRAIPTAELAGLEVGAGSKEVEVHNVAVVSADGQKLPEKSLLATSPDGTKLVADNLALYVGEDGRIFDSRDAMRDARVGPHSVLRDSAGLVMVTAVEVIPAPWRIFDGEVNRGEQNEALELLQETVERFLWQAPTAAGLPLTDNASRALAEMPAKSLGETLAGSGFRVEPEFADARVTHLPQMFPGVPFYGQDTVGVAYGGGYMLLQAVRDHLRRFRDLGALSESLGFAQDIARMYLPRVIGDASLHGGELDLALVSPGIAKLMVMMVLVHHQLAAADRYLERRQGFMKSYMVVASRIDFYDLWRAQDDDVQDFLRERAHDIRARAREIIVSPGDGGAPGPAAMDAAARQFWSTQLFDEKTRVPIGTLGDWIDEALQPNPDGPRLSQRLFDIGPSDGADDLLIIEFRSPLETELDVPELDRDAAESMSNFAMLRESGSYITAVARVAGAFAAATQELARGDDGRAVVSAVLHAAAAPENLDLVQQVQTRIDSYAALAGVNIAALREALGPVMQRWNLRLPRQRRRRGPLPQAISESDGRRSAGDRSDANTAAGERDVLLGSQAPQDWQGAGSPTVSDTALTPERMQELIAKWSPIEVRAVDGTRQWRLQSFDEGLLAGAVEYATFARAVRFEGDEEDEVPIRPLRDVVRFQLARVEGVYHVVQRVYFTGVTAERMDPARFDDLRRSMVARAAEGLAEVYDGAVLPDGSRLLLHMMIVDSAEHAHRIVNLVEQGRRAYTLEWPSDIDPRIIAHELGHPVLPDRYGEQLSRGLRDVYFGAWYMAAHSDAPLGLTLNDRDRPYVRSRVGFGRLHPADLNEWWFHVSAAAQQTGGVNRPRVEFADGVLERVLREPGEQRRYSSGRNVFGWPKLETGGVRVNPEAIGERVSGRVTSAGWRRDAGVALRRRWSTDDLLTGSDGHAGMTGSSVARSGTGRRDALEAVPGFASHLPRMNLWYPPEWSIDEVVYHVRVVYALAVWPDGASGIAVPGSPDVRLYTGDHNGVRTTIAVRGAVEVGNDGRTHDTREIVDFWPDPDQTTIGSVSTHPLLQQTNDRDARPPVANLEYVRARAYGHRASRTGMVHRTFIGDAGQDGFLPVPGVEVEPDLETEPDGRGTYLATVRFLDPRIAPTDPRSRLRNFWHKRRPDPNRMFPDSWQPLDVELAILEAHRFALTFNNRTPANRQAYTWVGVGNGVRIIGQTRDGLIETAHPTLNQPNLVSLPPTNPERFSAANGAAPRWQQPYQYRIPGSGERHRSTTLTFEPWFDDHGIGYAMTFSVRINGFEDLDDEVRDTVEATLEDLAEDVGNELAGAYGRRVVFRFEAGDAGPELSVTPKANLVWRGAEIDDVYQLVHEGEAVLRADGRAQILRATLLAFPDRFAGLIAGDFLDVASSSQSVPERTASLVRAQHPLASMQQDLIVEQPLPTRNDAPRLSQYTVRGYTLDARLIDQSLHPTEPAQRGSQQQETSQDPRDPGPVLLASGNAAQPRLGELLGADPQQRTVWLVPPAWTFHDVVDMVKEVLRHGQREGNRITHPSHPITVYTEGRSVTWLEYAPVFRQRIEEFLANPANQQDTAGQTVDELAIMLASIAEHPESIYLPGDHVASPMPSGTGYIAHGTYGSHNGGLYLSYDNAILGYFHGDPPITAIKSQTPPRPVRSDRRPGSEIPIPSAPRRPLNGSYWPTSSPTHEPGLDSATDPDPESQVPEDLIEGQQPEPPLSPPLTAKVGFELQIPGATVPLNRRGLVLVTGSGWRLELDSGPDADTGELEFVYAPMSSLREIHAATNDIVALLGQMRKIALQSPSREAGIADAVAGSGRSVALLHDMTVTVADIRLAGRLQATYGIGLESLADAISRTHTSRHFDAIQNATEKVESAYRRVHSESLTPRVKGFVDLINMYLQRAQGNTQPGATVHTLFRLMSRSDFASIYARLLDDVDQAQMRQLVLPSPGHLVPILMESLSLDVTDRVIARPYDLQSYNLPTFTTPVRTLDWLRSIVFGRDEGIFKKDLMSPPPGYRLHTGDLDVDYGMGAMGVDQNNGLVLYELRGDLRRPEMIPGNGNLFHFIAREYADASRYNTALPHDYQPSAETSYRYQLLSKLDAVFDSLDSFRRYVTGYRQITLEEWGYLVEGVIMPTLDEIQEIWRMNPAGAQNLFDLLLQTERALVQLLEIEVSPNLSDNVLGALPRYLEALTKFEQALWEAGNRPFLEELRDRETAFNAPDDLPPSSSATGNSPRASHDRGSEGFRRSVSDPAGRGRVPGNLPQIPPVSTGAVGEVSNHPLHVAAVSGRIAARVTTEAVRATTEPVPSMLQGEPGTANVALAVELPRNLGIDRAARSMAVTLGALPGLLDQADTWHRDVVGMRIRADARAFGAAVAPESAIARAYLTLVYTNVAAVVIGSRSWVRRRPLDLLGVVAPPLHQLVAQLPEVERQTLAVNASAPRAIAIAHITETLRSFGDDEAPDDVLGAALVDAPQGTVGDYLDAALGVAGADPVGPDWELRSDAPLAGNSPAPWVRVQLRWLDPGERSQPIAPEAAGVPRAGVSAAVEVALSQVPAVFRMFVLLAPNRPYILHLEDAVHLGNDITKDRGFPANVAQDVSGYFTLLHVHLAALLEAEKSENFSLLDHFLPVLSETEMVDAYLSMPEEAQLAVSTLADGFRALFAISYFSVEDELDEEEAVDFQLSMLEDATRGRFNPIAWYLDYALAPDGSLPFQRQFGVPMLAGRRSPGSQIRLRSSIKRDQSALVAAAGAAALADKQTVVSVIGAMEALTEAGSSWVRATSANVNSNGLETLEALADGSDAGPQRREAALALLAHELQNLDTPPAGTRKGAVEWRMARLKDLESHAQLIDEIHNDAAMTVAMNALNLAVPAIVDDGYDSDATVVVTGEIPGHRLPHEASRPSATRVAGGSPDMPVYRVGVPDPSNIFADLGVPESVLAQPPVNEFRAALAEQLRAAFRPEAGDLSRLRAVPQIPQQLDKAVAWWRRTRSNAGSSLEGLFTAVSALDERGGDGPLLPLETKAVIVAGVFTWLSADRLSEDRQGRSQASRDMLAAIGRLQDVLAVWEPVGGNAAIEVREASRHLKALRSELGVERPVLVDQAIALIESAAAGTQFGGEHSDLEKPVYGAIIRRFIAFVKPAPWEDPMDVVRFVSKVEAGEIEAVSRPGSWGRVQALLEMVGDNGVLFETSHAGVALIVATPQEGAKGVRIWRIEQAAEGVRTTSWRVGEDPGRMPPAGVIAFNKCAELMMLDHR